jgi:hypothetical protein
MNKFHFNVHLKNDNYMCKIGDSKKLDTREHIVRFKGIFDSIKEGWEYIESRFSATLKSDNYTINDLANSTSLTRINTSICTRYAEMFISQI